MTTSVTDPLAACAGTWLENPAPASGVPDGLRRPDHAGWFDRLALWRGRHLLRRERAEQGFAASRNPVRGLPVAESHVVVTFMGGLLGRRKPIIVVLLVINALAALASLVMPRLLGRLIDLAQADSAALAASVDPTVMIAVVVVLVQAALVFAARWISSVFGQDLLASAREHVVRTVLRLPLSRIESASTGDLVTRVTRDVNFMAMSVRWALPQLLVALSAAVLTLAGMFWNSWLLALPILVSLAVMFAVVRDYYRWASKGYIAEGAAYSDINATLTETVEGARTSEAFGLRDDRAARTDTDLEVAGQAERYTLALRNKLFVFLDLALYGPLALIILLGAWGHANGLVTLGQIAAATMYAQQLVQPMNGLVHTLDVLQVGMASTTRLLGISIVPPDRRPGEASPVDDHLVGSDLRFAYREGHDVLHGIDLDLVPGERLAVVGPSGSGKSTLGRLLAGVNRPRTGQVRVGGVDVMDFPLEQLRTRVALVTQEHHVFVGTLRDNIVLARETTATDDEVWDALTAVDAADWVRRLPDQLDTHVGSGNVVLTPAQAQQVALARLVIADPHTLVLDEATSLIDPHTARHLEGSMATLLAGRTVVAIAHRLHTAHDADRIAVVIDGRVAELGSHDELIDLNGEYAALWRVWTS